MADIIDFKTKQKKVSTAKQSGEVKEEPTDFTVLTLNSIGEEIPYSFKANEATRNILVTGETGSGKSTSIILPAIQSFIQNDCPGLVLDIKSDLYSSIHAIAKQHNKLDNLVFIGVHGFCESINILASIKTIEQLKNVLSSVKPYDSGPNAYWFHSGLMDVLDVVIIDKWFTEERLKEEYKFDFRKINSYINEPLKTKAMIDKAKNDIDFASAEIVGTINKVIREPFSLYPKNPEEWDGGDVTQQKMWRSGQISTILTELIKEPFYSKLFNAENPKSLHDYIYKDGKMLVLTVPLEHESTGYLVSKLLREVYFKAVCQNEIDDLDTYNIGPKFNRYTVLVIDEYQFYLNTEQQNGVITDENWLSISRGYYNINVFATQSISSMYSKSQNIHAVNTIVQNFANKFFLKSGDPATCEHAKFISGSGLFSELIEAVLLLPLQGRRNGFFKVADNGGMECNIFDYGSNELSTFMNSEQFKKLKKQSADDLKASAVIPPEKDVELTIISTTEKSFTLSNGAIKRRTDFAESDLYRNIKGNLKKHCRFLSDKDELVNKFIGTPKNVVFNEEFIPNIITMATNLGEHKQAYETNMLSHVKTFIQDMRTTDTTTTFASEDNEGNYVEIPATNILKAQKRIENGNNLKEATKKNLAELANMNIVVITTANSKGYEDFTSTFKYDFKKIIIQDLVKTINDKEYRTTKEGSNIIKTINKADIVCFVRGGGDLTHPSFSFYRNAGLIPTIKKINPSCTVVTAIGHASDVFLADLYADHTLITPTAAATFIRDLLVMFNHYMQHVQHDLDFMAEKQAEIKKPEIKKTSLTSRFLKLFSRG